MSSEHPKSDKTTQSNNVESDFLKSVLGITDEKPQKASNAKVVKPLQTVAEEKNMSQRIADSLADKLVSSVKASATNSIASTKTMLTDSLEDIKEITTDKTHAKFNNITFPADLTLAVVGHTNTGKTSLLRTLLRDSDFGEVKNASATTKHVERISIFDGDTPLLDLYDTPGLEDAGGLLDWLEDHTDNRADGVERLHTFLADEVSETDFNQEAKVIRQLLASDVALYVVDTREPVLGKYKDELRVLSWCAKPVMPIFNFIHEVTDDNMAAWQDMLSRRNLHVSTSFDTVAFDFDGEIQLWQNLETLLSNTTVSKPKLSNTLQRLINLRKEEWHELQEKSQIAIAHTLLNITAFKKEINQDDDPAPVLAEMQEQVRQLERRLHATLLSTYRFYDSDVAPTELKLESFQRDPFDPELLKNYGIRTTSGAVAGAIAGLGIDAATFGASLGLGAAIGGLIGGVLSNTQSISDKLSGVQSLYIDPATITLIATRATDLLSALMHRGHADQAAINLNNSDTSEKIALWEADKLPKPLKKARSREDWSELNNKDTEQSYVLRDEDAWDLAQLLTTKSN